MDPKGKTALVTGAARIGGAVAEALARRGAKIALAYRSSKPAAEATAARIRSAGGEAVIIQADLARAEDCERLAARAAEALGSLEILVSMASAYRKVTFEKLDAAAWDAAFAADARGAYLMALAAAPHMRRAGEGRIVNVSDWLAASGRPGYKGYLPYYAAKSALIGATEALALELAPEILVNAVAPGPILPPEEMSEAGVRAVELATPLGRWGGAEEIAKAVLFLVETRFVTGETIRVDGGRHLK